MWGFASKPIAGTSGLNNDSETTNQVSSESSDDDMTLNDCRREEGLECPICFESFNIVENVPYVLWCGHTLCKNCVLGLPWAVYKLPNLPIQLPFFISCPWCNLLSCRLVYKGELKFPHKNYFLLWMVENLNGDRFKSCSSSCDHLAIDEVSQCVGQSQSTNGSCAPHFNAERLQSSLYLIEMHKFIKDSRKEKKLIDFKIQTTIWCTWKISNDWVFNQVPVSKLRVLEEIKILGYLWLRNRTRVIRIGTMAEF